MDSASRKLVFLYSATTDPPFDSLTGADCHVPFPLTERVVGNSGVSHIGQDSEHDVKNSGLSQTEQESEATSVSFPSATRLNGKAAQHATDKHENLSPQKVERGIVHTGDGSPMTETTVGRRLSDGVCAILLMLLISGRRQTPGLSGLRRDTERVREEHATQDSS